MYGIAKEFAAVIWTHKVVSVISESVLLSCLLMQDSVRVESSGTTINQTSNWFYLNSNYGFWTFTYSFMKNIFFTCDI